MATSSIHIQRAVQGSVGHNSREHFSYSVVFKSEHNECTTDIKEAYKTYRSELQIRTEAYTERTGQKLQKKAVTQLSAVINLEQHHTLKDLEPIKAELERLFDTTIYQMAIHRDEGKLVNKADGTELYSGKDFFLNPEKNELFFDKKFTKPVPMNDYEIVKNYHAHIEMMGLDSKGNAIRQKMNKVALQGLQTTVAKTLNMERGKPRDGYTKEEMKQILKVVGKKSDYENTTLYAQKFNESAKELGIFKESDKRKDTHKFKDDGAEREKAKRQVLATQKDLNAEIAQLRSQLKEQGATRADYAEVEKIKREFTEQIKAKELSNDDLKKNLETVRSLRSFDQTKILELSQTVEALQSELQEAKAEIPHEPINASLIVQLQSENEILQITNKALETELKEAKEMPTPKGENEASKEIEKQIEEIRIPNVSVEGGVDHDHDALMKYRSAIDNQGKKATPQYFEKMMNEHSNMLGIIDKKALSEQLANEKKEDYKTAVGIYNIGFALIKYKDQAKEVLKSVVKSSKSGLESIFCKITGKSLPEVKKEREELVNAKPRGLREAVDELNKQKEPEKGIER